MTMRNATLRLAMLVVLLFAMRHSMHGQTTTTDTNCTVYGNTANCTSTSTDDSAQRRAQAEAQAEKDRQAEELGKSMGNALGAGIGAMARVHNFHKQVKQYCKQHPGETWTWGNDNNGEVYKSGQCPESPESKEKRKAFIAERDRLASSPEQQARSYRSEGGCESGGYIWENGQCVATRTPIKQSASTQREAYCGKYPRGSFPKPDGGWEYCDVRDDPANHASAAAPTATPALAKAEPLVNTGSSGTVIKAVASAVPQSAPAVAPAASPAATGTADTPKPCFTDKSGHTVCLAQH
jgi:hypothetical protein